MKPFLTLLFFCCVLTNLKPQSVDFYGNSLHKDICSTYGMKDDAEAKESLDKICDAAAIPNNFVLQPCANIDNCFALYKNGYSYIVYDIEFFKKIKTFGFTEKNLPKNNVDWVALTILAHELGHHMCLHTTNPNLSSLYTPVQIETQADEYAGRILYRLGATLAQAQQAMNSDDVPEQQTITHPGRRERLAAIANGWNKEFKNADRNGSLQNDPTPTSFFPIDNTNDSIAHSLSGVSLPNMVQVEGGTFYMGSNDANEEMPIHMVNISGFYISTFEITQQQWWSVMGYNPSLNKCESCPVENISWGEADSFCQKLSKITGKVVRLPSEAEWEYAARGGNKNYGYLYSGGNNIDDVAWYGENSIKQTHPSGGKKPNPLGLYDMSGNVLEWCNDWFGYYAAEVITNPKGSKSGTYKILKGGGWHDPPGYCRITDRGSEVPSNKSGDIGFRVVVSY